MELGDVDGDGDVDAFVSRGTSTFNALPSQVFLNDGRELSRIPDKVWLAMSANKLET